MCKHVYNIEKSLKDEVVPIEYASWSWEWVEFEEREGQNRGKM